MTNLQDFYVAAGKWSCLAQDYIMAVMDVCEVPEDVRDVVLSNAVLAAWESGSGIDKEFFVSDPIKLMEATARMLGKSIKVSVSKKDISSLTDLPSVGYAAVRWDNNGNSHFALCKNQRLFYNSLAQSQCCLKGKIATARIIDIQLTV